MRASRSRSPAATGGGAWTTGRTTGVACEAGSTQAERWPALTGFSSGKPWRHASCTSAQRAAKGHPGCSMRRLGGLPGMDCSTVRCEPTRGTEARSPRV